MSGISCSTYCVQASLVAAWFEMVGFNRHGNRTLAELLSILRDDAANSNGASSNYPFLSSSGLSVAAFRMLVSTSKPAPTDWINSGIGQLLHFQPSAMRMETRYQVQRLPVPNRVLQSRDSD